MKEDHPHYGTIPGVSVPVSRLFFGTAIYRMLTGGDADALLDAAFALGVNAFDTARGYGLAEQSLGKWIRARGNRDRVTILTKCGNIDREGRVRVDREVILSELEQSLSMLGVENVDIYLLHRDDPNTPVSELIETLNACKAAGKIKTFGVSNWTHERIAEANAYAASRGLEGFSVSSPNYGLARQTSDPWGGGCVTVSGPENAAARAWYTEQRMPVIAYSGLGRGFFSGRFRSFDYDEAKRVLDYPAQKGYLCEENMRRLRNAEVLAERFGTTVSDIALRYIFGSGMDLYAVVSASDPARLAQNIASSNQPLSAEDIAFLERDTE